MYELIENNADFVVIYKKPNVSFHSESGEPGLFETLKQQEHFPELYPVHRLDKITSGVLVMAKTASVNRELTEQFRARTVEKYYLAISIKKSNKKQGLIKGDMAQARRGAWKLLTTQYNPAVTQFFNKGIGEGKRLFIIKPHTGKTHQIRVALKSIGAPIAGDLLYGDINSNSELDRGYLHAYSLAFKLGEKNYHFYSLPREGAYFLSEDFLVGIIQYQQPWSLAWPQVK